MSPKTMMKANPATKKEPSKKPKELSKSNESTGPAKPEKKNLQAKSQVAPESQPEGDAPVIDADELEEQEDAASSEASGSGGNAAALAAASGSTEVSASFKNFRHHPDMENFYRFIFENDLRHEALAIIDEIMAEKLQRRLVKGSKAQAH